MEDSLLLKWGTLKGWNLKNEKSRQILQRYLDLGSSLSCMAQKDTDEQKQILCELIREHTGTITSDWSGESFTKDEAIYYIMNYGKQ